MEESPKAESASEPARLLSYGAPTLVRFGSLADLTGMVTNMGMADGGSGSMRRSA